VKKNRTRNMKVAKRCHKGVKGEEGEWVQCKRVSSWKGAIRQTRGRTLDQTGGNEQKGGVEQEPQFEKVKRW